MIRLFVVIPVYGNWEDTLECLQTLASQTTSDFRVLVADDGSPSPPPSAIHLFPFVEYTRHENRGFAANCNRAAHDAMSRGATHLLFLNSDTWFQPTFVQQWLLALAAMPDAILSPQIYWFHDPSRIWFSGGQLTVWVPFLRLKRSYRRITNVDIVCGCAMLVPSARWRDLGGFDDKYVMYFEDLDLTLRAKRMGVNSYVLPEPALQVWHKVGGSFRGKRRWRQHYLLLTSSLIFIRSHYRGKEKWLCLCFQFVHLAAVLVQFLPELPSPTLLWKAVAGGLSAKARVAGDTLEAQTLS